MHIHVCTVHLLYYFYNYYKYSTISSIISINFSNTLYNAVNTVTYNYTCINYNVHVHKCTFEGGEAVGWSLINGVGLIFFPPPVPPPLVDCSCAADIVCCCCCLLWASLSSTRFLIFLSVSLTPSSSLCRTLVPPVIPVAYAFEEPSASAVFSGSGYKK